MPGVRWMIPSSSRCQTSRRRSRPACIDAVDGSPPRFLCSGRDRPHRARGDQQSVRVVGVHRPAVPGGDRRPGATGRYLKGSTDERTRFARDRRPIRLNRFGVQDDKVRGCPIDRDPGQERPGTTTAGRGHLLDRIRTGELARSACRFPSANLTFRA